MKLVNSDEFTAVFNHKKRLSSENLFLYYCPNKISKNRLGFVVPKRIERLAVRRNYMRRSLREIFKNIFNSNHNYYFDFIVIIKKTFYKEDFYALKAQVNNLFLKLPQ
jgi:ribonuclease P protein component